MILAGCGNITLERYQDTSVSGLIDPDGLCTHLDQELYTWCAEDATVDIAACVTQCVAAGGSEVEPYSGFDDCFHDGSESCQTVRECLALVGSSCAPIP